VLGRLRGRDKATKEEAQKLLDALSGAQTGATGAVGTGAADIGGITLDEGTGETVKDGVTLQDGVDLIEWWCTPSSAYGADVEKHYQYDGLINPDGDESYSFSFGTYKDGEFVPERYFGVSVDGKRIYELNLFTVTYTKIYDADPSSHAKTAFPCRMYRTGALRHLRRACEAS
jgi:hypothetical protein